MLAGCFEGGVLGDGVVGVDLEDGRRFAGFQPHTASSYGVVDVLFVGAPAEVLEGIVGCVAVYVVDFLAFCGRGKKCFSNEEVDVFGYGFAGGGPKTDAAVVPFVLGVAFDVGGVQDE